MTTRVLLTSVVILFSLCALPAAAQEEEEEDKMQECIDKLADVASKTVGSGDNPSAEDIANQATEMATAQADASAACAAAFADQQSEEGEISNGAEVSKPRREDSKAVLEAKAKKLDELRVKIEALLAKLFVATGRINEMLMRMTSEQLSGIKTAMEARTGALNDLKGKVSQYLNEAMMFASTLDAAPMSTTSTTVIAPAITTPLPSPMGM